MRHDESEWSVFIARASRMSVLSVIRIPAWTRSRSSITVGNIGSLGTVSVESGGSVLVMLLVLLVLSFFGGKTLLIVTCSTKKVGKEG